MSLLKTFAVLSPLRAAFGQIIKFYGGRRASAIPFIKKILYPFDEVKVSLVLPIVILVGLCLWGYYRQDDIYLAVFLLLIISIAPLLCLSLMLPDEGVFNAWLETPVVRLILLVVFAACVWVGHAQTTDRLTEVYGPASEHMPLTFAAGTFFTSLGLLAIPVSAGMVVAEILAFLAMIVTETKSGASSISKNCYIKIVAIMLLLGVGGATLKGMFSSRQADLFLDTVAFELDLYDVARCDPKVMDKNGNLKIAYADPEHYQAYVFRRNGPPRKKIVKLTRSDFNATRPEYEGILICPDKPFRPPT